MLQSPQVNLITIHNVVFRMIPLCFVCNISLICMQLKHLFINLMGYINLICNEAETEPHETQDQ